MLNKKRADLAQAIAERNEAAKACEAAERAFVECAGLARRGLGNESRIGAKYLELRNKHYRLQDVLRALEAKRDEILARGESMMTVHRTFMHEHDGKAADEVIDAAKTEFDEVEKEFARLGHAMAKLDAKWSDAEIVADRLEKRVASIVSDILEDEVVRLAEELKETSNVAMRQLGALLKVAERINFQHHDCLQTGHPHHIAGSLIRQYGMLANYASNQGEIRSLNLEGAAPWIAAANRLAVDASAPLPTDPKSSPRKVAA
jgi:G:T-mismatch repair DNA endonuclease (very short patch repair protein)